MVFISNVFSDFPETYPHGGFLNLSNAQHMKNLVEQLYEYSTKDGVSDVDIASHMNILFGNMIVSEDKVSFDCGEEPDMLPTQTHSEGPVIKLVTFPDNKKYIQFGKQLIAYSKLIDELESVVEKSPTFFENNIPSKTWANTHVILHHPSSSSLIFKFTSGDEIKVEGYTLNMFNNFMEHVDPISSPPTKPDLSPPSFMVEEEPSNIKNILEYNCLSGLLQYLMSFRHD